MYMCIHIDQAGHSITWTRTGFYGSRSSSVYS